MVEEHNKATEKVKSGKCNYIVKFIKAFMEMDSTGKEARSFECRHTAWTLTLSSGKY